MTANYGKISNLNSIAATLGGWTLADNRFYAVSGSTYCGMSADMQWDTRFYAGASNSAGADAAFFVTQRGTMVATNAQIKGSIQAGSSISGTSISASTISGGAISGTTITGTTISGSTISGGTINVGGIMISSSRTGHISWAGSTTCYVNMAEGMMSIYHGNQINIIGGSNGGVNIGGSCYLPYYTFLNGRQIKVKADGSLHVV